VTAYFVTDTLKSQIYYVFFCIIAANCKRKLVHKKAYFFKIEVH